MMKHIIFDCYGTLINTGKGSIEAVKAILANVGSDVPAEDFYAHWKRIKKHMMDTDEFVTEKKFFELSLKETFAKFGITADATVEVKPMIDSLFSRRNIYDEVKPMLEGLAAMGFTYAIGSTTDTDSIMCHLNQNELTVPLVFTSEDMKVYKPKADFYRTILNQTGWDVSECVFVGDNYVDDVLGPKSIGMKAVLLDRNNKFNKADCEIQPDYIVSNLLELIDILEVANGQR